MTVAGRPHDMDKPLDTDPDTGETITVADRILAALKVGTPMAGASSSAGVTVATFYQWLRDGAKVERTLQANPEATLTPYEQRACQFSYAVAQVIGEWEWRMNETLDRLAFGGTEIVTITKKVKTKEDGTEEVLDESRKVERLGPNAQVLQWRLRARFPDRYSERLEVSGPGGEPIPIESRAKLLVESLTKFQDEQAKTAAAELEAATGGN